MAILLTEVPLDAVTTDLARFPDRDDRAVIDHLIYCCSKGETLPAVTVVIVGGNAVVTRGHTYLAVAAALHHRTIRAVISSPESSADVAVFLGRNNVKRIDWEALNAAERAEPVPTAFHIFFFERPLLPVEKREFDERVANLFKAVPQNAPPRVNYDEAQGSAEFQAATPLEDHAWAAEHLATFTQFSRDHVRIVSYQGRKFGPRTDGI